MMRSACGMGLALLLAAFVSAAWPAHAADPVGIRQVEFRDGDRTIALFLFYPAAASPSARPFPMPFFTNLRLLDGVEPDFSGGPRPLVVLSHGRGSNALIYAWFAQYLVERGFIVAGINHYRASTYDSNITYLAGKIWQRPVDISLAIDFLLADPVWRAGVDASKIGVAGHSQGGFTALWVGGAKVNADRFLAFQRAWKERPAVPAFLRAEMPLDPAPALDVHDTRVKGAFAMAPGIIQAFGMDEAGLLAMAVPAYITVGARDTQTPAGPNAEFAAKNIPGATLAIIPGAVDHEIFANECDEEGRDEFPETCIDAPGVDRAAIHRSVGEAAVTFFSRALGIARP